MPLLAHVDGKRADARRTGDRLVVAHQHGAGHAERGGQEDPPVGQQLNHRVGLGAGQVGEPPGPEVEQPVKVPGPQRLERIPFLLAEQLRADPHVLQCVDPDPHRLVRRQDVARVRGHRQAGRVGVDEAPAGWCARSCRSGGSRRRRAQDRRRGLGPPRATARESSTAAGPHPSPCRGRPASRARFPACLSTVQPSDIVVTC